MSATLKPLKGMENPAGNVITTPDFFAALEGFIEKEVANDQMSIVGANASADTETTVVAPTIPLQTMSSTPVPPEATKQQTPNRFQDFTLTNLNQNTPDNGFVPLPLDISDIENNPLYSEEVKAKMIEDRKKYLDLQNYILKQKFEERIKFNQQNEKASQIWLDKMTPQQADETQKKQNAQALRKLIAAALIQANNEEDLKEVTHAVEATAAALDTLTTRSSHLESVFQENQRLKSENESLKNENNTIKNSQQASSQQAKHQTSLVSPVKTIPSQPSQSSRVQEELKKLNEYGKVCLQGYMKQNVSNPNIERDINLAYQAQQLASTYSSVPENVTYEQLYGKKIFDEIHNVKNGPGVKRQRV